MTAPQIQQDPHQPKEVAVHMVPRVRTHRLPAGRRNRQCLRFPLTYPIDRIRRAKATLRDPVLKRLRSPPILPRILTEWSRTGSRLSPNRKISNRQHIPLGYIRQFRPNRLLHFQQSNLLHIRSHPCGIPSTHPRQILLPRVGRSRQNPNVRALFHQVHTRNPSHKSHQPDSPGSCAVTV